MKTFLSRQIPIEHVHLSPATYCLLDKEHNKTSHSKISVPVEFDKTTSLPSCASKYWFNTRRAMIKSFVLFAFLATLTLCRVHGVPMTALQGDTGWMEMSRFWIRLPNLDYRKEVVVSEASIGGSKIAGGTIAEKQQFPYQAAILINFLDGSGVLCGGAIISSTYVLTAAHCSDGAIDATVIVGTNVISIPSDDQAVEIKVTFHDILVHPLYDPVEVVNDIAIVRLTRALAFSSESLLIFLCE